MLTHKTPRWIIVGALLLASGAGCINAVGFLGAHHQALTHMSGTVTNLGVELVRGDASLAWRAFGVMLFFFFGCLLSGLVIRESTLRLGRRYGVALALESALLFAAALLLRHDVASGDFLAAMACGLQNAMATSYSGAVLRTTHMTGIITDLGIALGLAARGSRVDWRRLRLYLVVLAGFFSGGLLGAIGFLRFGTDTLLFPAAIAGVTGLSYTVFKHHERRRHTRTPVTGTARTG
jgi:uncharacterized membrane protein YoaK (UPF0700 family)